MPRTHLVITICDREHCVGATDASAQILDQVERCLVCPMHVFEYNERLLALQLIQRRGEDFVAVRAGTDRRQQCSFRLPRDVVQWGERSRCKERITCPPKYPGLALLLGELLYQCGFADARFASNERNAAASLGGGMEPFHQIRKTSFTL